MADPFPRAWHNQARKDAGGDVAKQKAADDTYNKWVADDKKGIAAIEKTAKQINDTVQRGIDAIGGDSPEAKAVRDEFATHFVDANTLDDKSDFYKGVGVGNKKAALTGLSLLITPTGMAKGVATKVGSIGLDTNAIIAMLEGSPAEARAVLNAIGARVPFVSITAIKEFLRGGGDINSLRSYLQSTGGGVGKGASTATIQKLQGNGLKAADASVVGSAVDSGMNVLTRDKQILKKAPGVSESY